MDDVRVDVGRSRQRGAPALHDSYPAKHRVVADGCRSGDFGTSRRCSGCRVEPRSRLTEVLAGGPTRLERARHDGYARRTPSAQETGQPGSAKSRRAARPRASVPRPGPIQPRTCRPWPSRGQRTARTPRRRRRTTPRGERAACRQRFPPRMRDRARSRRPWRTVRTFRGRSPQAAGPQESTKRPRVPLCAVCSCVDVSFRVFR